MHQRLTYQANRPIDNASSKKLGTKAFQNLLSLVVFILLQFGQDLGVKSDLFVKGEQGFVELGTLTSLRTGLHKHPNRQTIWKAIIELK